MRIILVLLLWVSAALANPILFSGFDGVDSNVTNTGSLEFPLVTAGTPAASAFIEQKTIVHNSANGGDSSSLWALIANPAASQAGGWHLNSVQQQQVLNGSVGLGSLAVGMTLNVDTAPASGERVILTTIETDGTQGCYITLDSSRLLHYYYKSSSNSWGTSSAVMQIAACSNDPLTPCSNASTDCPGSGATCVSSNRYFGSIELAQFNQSNSAVFCDSYVDGVAQFVNVIKNVGNVVNNINDVYWGLPNYGSISQGAKIYVDDLVLDDSGKRAYPGYVATKLPLGDYTDSRLNFPCTWTTNCTGGAGGDPINCVNDYTLTSGCPSTTPCNTYFNGSSVNDVLRTGKILQTCAVTLSPTITVPAKAKISAVEPVWFGRTNTTPADRQLDGVVLICNFGGCNLETQTDTYITQNTGTYPQTIPSPQALVYYPAVTDTNGAGWTSNMANSTILAMISGSHVDSQFHVGAGIEYLRIQRPDSPSPAVSRDHNLGTDDNKITYCLFGDSTLGGTSESFCPSGANQGLPCTQDSYCVWDTDFDKPVGGCGATGGFSPRCATCTSRRNQFGSNAGYPCCTGSTVGTCSDSNCNLGSCNTNCQGSALTCAGSPTFANCCCSGDPAVTCASPSDCNLGTCESAYNGTSVSCVASCPGSHCNDNKAGWGQSFAGLVGADNVIRYAHGGESIAGMYQIEFQKAMLGNLPGGVPLAVSGGGNCQCASSGDCPGGGTCSSNVCVGGTTCVQNTDCSYPTGTLPGGGGPASICQFPACDDAFVVMGYNDQLQSTLFTPGLIVGDDPNCNNPNSSNYFAIFSNPITCPKVNYGSGGTCGSEVQCSSNSACTAAPDQQCFGICIAPNPTYPAFTNVSRVYCTTSAECPAYTVPSSNPAQTIPGGVGTNTCTMEVGSYTSNGVGRIGSGCSYNGDCRADLGQTCSVSSNPGQGQTGYCKCTSNGNCPSGYVCGANNKCMLSCTTNADCRLGTCLATGSVSGGCNIGLANCCSLAHSVGCTTSADCDNQSAQLVCDTGATPKVCKGACNCPCDVVACASDQQCGGSNMNSQTGGQRNAFYFGQCNPDSGRCFNCGTQRCQQPSNLVGKCSCTSSADCNGGTCSGNLCTTGAKSSCYSDVACPGGHKCIGAYYAYANWQKAHAGLNLQTYLLMQSWIDQYSDPDGRPLIFPSGLPLVGGELQDGNLVNCQDCASLFADLNYYKNIYRDVKTYIDPTTKTAKFPSYRITDFTAGFDNLRFTNAFHVDCVHYNGPGSGQVGTIEASTANAVNVCYNAGGSPQKYCLKPTSTCTENIECAPSLNASAGSCSGGFCNPTTIRAWSQGAGSCKGADTHGCKPCALQSDCSAGEKCIVRKCNGVDANCPQTGDVCHAE